MVENKNLDFEVLLFLNSCELPVTQAFLLQTFSNSETCGPEQRVGLPGFYAEFTFNLSDLSRCSE